jgi:ISXO2-like transposase domain/Transposase zinc-ribbon domain
VPSSDPQPGVDYPPTFHELLDWFPDDQACLSYLERVRWSGGFLCPCCGAVGGDWWAVRRGLRKCAVCRHETSVTAGTIFHGSRLPLRSWFGAIWYVVNQKNGVSALGLQRVLGFGSYQTAWAWLHKLRRAMVLPGRELLTGAVEIDETLVGGVKPSRPGRSTDGKALVVIAAECHDNGPGRVRMCRIANASAEMLTDLVLDDVARGNEVRTDGWRATTTSAATASRTWSRT